MTEPALVIFDMAGTTVEDRGQVPATLAATLTAHHITVTADDITRVRGGSKRQAIRDLIASSRPEEGAPATEAFEAEADRIYADFRRRLTAAYCDGGARCVPGADAVIGDLRARDVKVALTTGFDRDIATLLLATIGWTPHMIDIIVCGDDVAHGRPAPDMIVLAMQLCGVDDPKRVANVGDTVFDLESAARAGVCWNVGVLTGAHTRDALERAPHTHIIDSVTELGLVFLEAGV
jgi:phosphonatase-like hydrolase